MIEVGIFMLCLAAFIWSMVLLAFRVRAKMHDGICGCRHGVSFHLADGGSRCHYKRAGYEECQCQRFVPLTDVRSAMIELGERSIGR